MIRIQETAKWLFATVGAIAVALLAGVRYADVSRAQPWARLLLTFLTLLTVACILQAIWNIGRVLAAKPVTLSRLLAPERGDGGYVRPLTAMTWPLALLGQLQQRADPVPARREPPRPPQGPTHWDDLSVGGQVVTPQVVHVWLQQRLDQARLVRTLREEWWRSQTPEQSVEHTRYVIEVARLEAYDEALTVVEAIGQFRLVKDTYNVAREWVIASTLTGFLTLTAAVNLIPAHVPA